MGIKHTEETKKLISRLAKDRWKNEIYRNKIISVNKGKILSNEHKNKISEGLLKLKRKNSPETIKKMKESALKRWSNPQQKINHSKIFKNRYISPETREKLRIAMLKRGTPNISPEGRKKISKTHEGNKYNLGRKLSIETKNKLSKMRKGKSKPQIFIDKISGDGNGMWKGGLSYEPYTIEFCNQLKKKIKQKYNYTCQMCMKKTTKRLDCHHIDYDKKNNDINNIIPLCRSCHAKTNHNRDYWGLIFNGR